MTMVRLPLGDVARNRNRRSPDLIGQTVDLPLRKTVCQFVNLSDHVHGLLPDHEIFEMLSHPRISLGTGY